MESTCRRCHQSLPEECGYCPVCGLPQMVYDAEYAQTAVEQPDGASPIRDADSIAWSRALKACLILAVPAGLLSSAISPIGGLGFLLAAAAAAWSVAR